MNDGNTRQNSFKTSSVLLCILLLAVFIFVLQSSDSAEAKELNYKTHVLSWFGETSGK